MRERNNVRARESESECVSERQRKCERDRHSKRVSLKGGEVQPVAVEGPLRVHQQNGHLFSGGLLQNENLRPNQNSGKRQKIVINEFQN